MNVKKSSFSVFSDVDIDNEIMAVKFYKKSCLDEIQTIFAMTRKIIAPLHP